MNSHRISIFILACMWMYGHVLAQAPDLQRMDIVLKSVPDGPVAKVFGTNIPSQRFVRFYDAELKRIRSAVGAESLSPQARLELGMWCIQKLVEQEVLYQDGVRNKVKITREELERSWSEQLGSFRASPRGSAEGSLTEDEVLEKIGVGSREEALREVRRALTILKMRTRIVKKAEIEVDESKVTETYSVAKERLNTPDKIHLRQIFFRADTGGTSTAKRLREEARNRANDSMARIDAGQSVASIASSASNAPDRKAGGGHGASAFGRITAIHGGGCTQDGGRRRERSDRKRFWFPYYRACRSSFEP